MLSIVPGSVLRLVEALAFCLPSLFAFGSDNLLQSESDRVEYSELGHALILSGRRLVVGATCKRV